MQVKTNDGRDAHSASGIGRIRSPGVEQGGIMLSPEAMTEPSSDGLKENKKERKLEQVSFFLPDTGQATALPVIPHFRGACPNC